MTNPNNVKLGPEITGLTEVQKRAALVGLIRSVCALELDMPMEFPWFGCKTDDELVDLFESEKADLILNGAYDGTVMEVILTLCHG